MNRITTGGTAAGVMKLVGDALKSYKRASPCLAIAPFGIIHGRTRDGETGLEITPEEVNHASQPAFAANLRAALVNVKSSVPMFSVLPPDVMSAVEMAFEPVAFAPFETIMVQGESSGEGLFIIETGTCEIIMDETVVNTVSASAYFGEKGLLKADEKRSATVRAMDGPVTCFRCAFLHSSVENEDSSPEK